MIGTILQIMPIGNYKYYSNYSIVTNTKNKEFVSRNSILLRNKESGNRTSDSTESYHNPRCLSINGYGENTIDTSNLIGYNIIDYQQQIASYDEIDDSREEITRTFYYYPHSGSGAYECVIGRDEVLFTTDNLINNTPFSSINDRYDETQSIYEGKYPSHEVRTAYITALAREKYNLYKVSDYFDDHS